MADPTTSSLLPLPKDHLNHPDQWAAGLDPATDKQKEVIKLLEEDNATSKKRNENPSTSTPSTSVEADTFSRDRETAGVKGEDEDSEAEPKGKNVHPTAQTTLDASLVFPSTLVDDEASTTEERTSKNARMSSEEGEKALEDQVKTAHKEGEKPKGDTDPTTHPANPLPDEQKTNSDPSLPSDNNKDQEDDNDEEMNDQGPRVALVTSDMMDTLVAGILRNTHRAFVERNERKQKANLPVTGGTTPGDSSHLDHPEN